MCETGCNESPKSDPLILLVLCPVDLTYIPASTVDRGTGFTAFLNINYRRPLPTGNAVLITVEMEKLEGRKVFMKASMTDGVDKHFSDATCLFVHPKKEDPVEVAHARTESS